MASQTVWISTIKRDKTSNSSYHCRDLAGDKAPRIHSKSNMTLLARLAIKNCYVQKSGHPMLAVPPLQLQKDNDLRTNVFATLVTSARDSLAKHEGLYANNRTMHKYVS